MALSHQTINKLASALVPEVIDYIYQDERWCEFMQEVVPDALQEQFGEIDEELKFQLAMCIMDRICFKQG
jgi:hypothetical protein